MKFKRIAIDTSKHVFTLHGVDEQDRPLLRLDLKRGQVEAFFGKLEATEVVLEACGGSHHWGRLLARLGHRVRLIPPQYVKPFGKRAKNDRADAEAISEAASRPTMPSVAVKTAEQQAGTIILKHREMLVAQRTQAINALRGHAAELGVVAAKGAAQVQALLDKLAATEAIPAVARAMFAQMGVQFAAHADRAKTNLGGPAAEIGGRRDTPRFWRAEPAILRATLVPCRGCRRSGQFAWRTPAGGFLSSRHRGHQLGEPDDVEHPPQVVGQRRQLNSARTFSRPRIRNAPWFIHCLMLPNGCSAVSRRRSRMPGRFAKRAAMRSNTASFSRVSTR